MAESRKNRPAGTAASQVASPPKSEKPEESKSERFVRLAQKRTTVILGQVNRLGNLASSNYSYTPEQVAKMFDAIESAVSAQRSKFEASTTKDEAFSL